MTNEEKTIAGTWYTITCTAAATVTEQIHGETATLATLSESGTAAFRASSPSITIDTEGKYHILPTRAPAIAAMGGGALTTMGETIVPLAESLIPIQHGIWYKNTEFAEVGLILPSLQNRVATCYLYTTVPVNINGVEWLYGQPVMVEGYTYIIAIQYLDGHCLSNLAYTIKQTN